MITFKVNGEGDEITFDEQSLKFPESLELEAQTGLGANKYMAELVEGTTTSTAALIWLGAVKHAAQRDGLSFRDAARQHPFAQFTDTLDLLTTMKTARRPVAPDPTVPAQEPAADGLTDSTSPATSEPPQPLTASPGVDEPTSESSPSSSASAPGSGTF